VFEHFRDNVDISGRIVAEIFKAVTGLFLPVFQCLQGLQQSNTATGWRWHGEHGAIAKCPFEWFTNGGLVTREVGCIQHAAFSLDRLGNGGRDRSFVEGCSAMCCDGFENSALWRMKAIAGLPRATVVEIQIDQAGEPLFVARDAAEFFKGLCLNFDVMSVDRNSIFTKFYGGLQEFSEWQAAVALSGQTESGDRSRDTAGQTSANAECFGRRRLGLGLIKFGCAASRCSSR
jgi:hypothetical protein